MTETQSVADILAHPLGDVMMVPIGDVKPYHRNPRKIPPRAVEQVASSIREFGWQQPLVVDGSMVIIIGHTRRQAAIKLGLTEVPVLVETRLTEEQTRALRIADNRTRDYTTWLYPMLMTELSDLDDYADTLDLANWMGLVTEFEESQQAALLDIDDDTEQLITDTFKLTCTFDSKENAELAAPVILSMTGAVNVRYGNREKRGS
jgi:hypothetical protein